MTERRSTEQRSLDDVPSDAYFVVIHSPNWPMVMVEETDDPNDPRMALFDTFEEAEKAALGNRAVQAYGAEVMRLENGDWICPVR